MNGAAALRILTAIGGCLLSMLLTYQILYSPTGGVAMLISSLGATAVMAAIINPRTGLYLTAFSTVYLEFGKKLAVYYGEVSPRTLIQVLMVSIACLAGTYLGIFFRAFIFRTITLQRSNILLFLLTGAITGMLFVSARGDGGVTGAAQIAINGGLYIGLIPTMAILLSEKEAALKFIRFIFWILLPWPIWGIRQYFFGYTQLEWSYALTGLSPVSSRIIIDPNEIIGLGSNAGSYAIITVFAAFGFWHAFFFKSRRLLYFLAGVLFYAGCIFSNHRTILIFPVMALAFYWFCLRPSRTIAAYVIGMSIFLAGVLSSGWLLANIDNINSFTTELLPGKLGQSLSVSTYSERLYGWQRFLVPESYSLLGRLGAGWSGPATSAEAAQEYNHDLINKILINFGVVGLLVAGILLLVLVRAVHRLVFSAPDSDTKHCTAIMIACVIPLLALSFIGGGSLNANPNNLVCWAMMGAALALNQRSKQGQPLQIQSNTPENTIPAPSYT